jgi:hypothetical protein
MLSIASLIEYKAIDIRRAPDLAKQLVAKSREL